jgi:hypothetical protein
MNPACRESDLSTKPYPQSERFYSEEGLWYFKTREGNNIGPFRYLSEARSMLERFLADVRAAKAQRQMTAGNKPHFRTPANIGGHCSGSSGQMT